jgi:hypothetical protein
MNRLRFGLKWLRWFISAPIRIRYGFDPHASRNWHIAMDRWEALEPQQASPESAQGGK